MTDIRHITFSCLGCGHDITVAGVRCDQCSTRRGVTLEEWKFLRALLQDSVGCRPQGDRPLPPDAVAMAVAIIDRALKDLDIADRAGAIASQA